jgi:hypothetical protein
MAGWGAFCLFAQAMQSRPAICTCSDDGMSEAADGLAPNAAEQQNGTETPLDADDWPLLRAGNGNISVDGGASHSIVERPMI